MSENIDPRFIGPGHPDLPEINQRPANHYVPYWDSLGKALAIGAPAAFLAAGVGAGLGAMRKKEDKKR